MEQKQQKEMSRNYLKIRTDFQLRVFLKNWQFFDILQMFKRTNLKLLLKQRQMVVLNIKHHVGDVNIRQIISKPYQLYENYAKD